MSSKKIRNIFFCLKKINIAFFCHQIKTLLLKLSKTGQKNNKAVQYTFER